jgi:hypothetical protein
MARMALISPSSSIILALTFLNENESNKQKAIPQGAPLSGRKFAFQRFGGQRK